MLIMSFPCKMAQNTHSHSKREEREHSEETLSQSKSATQQVKYQILWLHFPYFFPQGSISYSSIASANSATNCGPSVQISEPMGNISYSNYLR